MRSFWATFAYVIHRPEKWLSRFWTHLSKGFHDFFFIKIKIVQAAILSNGGTRSRLPVYLVCTQAQCWPPVSWLGAVQTKAHARDAETAQACEQ